MITYGRKENISEWRDGMMEHLRNRGTFEACRQIERVAAELPELRETLKWTLYQARAEARRQTWLTPRPEHVLALASRPGARLVQNGDQLLEVLVESLERFQEKLHGKTPAVFAPWNEVGGSYTPKDEERLSDEVTLHLEQDLVGRGVVVNREVVIRRGVPGRRGQRTDIHVDALVPCAARDQYETVSAIVEAKGCWNSDLNTAMQTQLVDRYLEGNRCHHGLYLVGWFNCEQWDTEHRRRKRPPAYGVEEARSKFEEQAHQLSRGDLRVKAVILDTALR